MCLPSKPSTAFSTRGPRVVPNLDWIANGNFLHTKHSASVYCQPYLPWISVASGFQSCNLHSASRTSHRHGLHEERDQSNVTGPAANKREHTDSVTRLINGSVIEVSCVKNETIKSLRYTVIPRLTKIIRSGITFFSRNFSLSRKWTTQSGWCVSPMWCGQLISLSHTYRRKR